MKLNRATLVSLTVSTLLAGCLQSDEGSGADDIQLTLVEQYCVNYTVSGPMMKGTDETCFRKWGLESFTKSETKIGFGGFSKNEKKHNITMDGKIYSIDPDKMTGTVMDNPMNEMIEQGNTENMAQSIFDSLGYAPTGESKIIAETPCNVYNSSMAGSACFTEQFIMLEASMMGTNRVATRLSTVESGDDGDYYLWQQAEISEAPDLEDIMSQLGGANNQD